MILRVSKKSHGGALLAIMIFAIIVAGLLSGYLIMVSKENIMVQRSQTWNNAMSLAEAGVEEAMAAINKPVGIPGGVTNWYTTAKADGWSTNSQSTYTNLSWTYNGQAQTWTNVALI